MLLVISQRSPLLLLEGQLAIEALVSLAELPAGKHMPLGAAQLDIVQSPGTVDCI